MEGPVVATRSVTSKVARLLQALALSPHRNPTEISKVTGLTHSTTRRLLHELVAARLIHRSDLGTYSLAGATAAEAVPSGARLRRLAYPLMLDLAAATGRQVSLGLLERHTVNPGESVGANPRAGRSPQGRDHLPLHASAMGKALLAYSPRAFLDEVNADGALHRYTSQTIVDPDELRRALNGVRRDGIAISWEEYDSSSAAAVIVFTPSGTASSAIGMQTFGVEDVAEIQPALTFAALALARLVAKETRKLQTA